MPRLRSGLFTLCLAALAGLISTASSPPCLAQSTAQAPPARPAEPPGFDRANQPEIDPNRHIRVIEEDGGRILKLQLSSRRFVPVDPSRQGPAVYLTGAVHIADQSFYDDVQKFLDAKDVVLFEAVKPPGAGDMEHFGQSDEQRVTATRRRIQLLALLVEQYKSRQHEYPTVLSQLPAGIDPKLVKILDGMTTDAWGRALIYRLDARIHPPAPDGPPGARETRVTSFDLISYGSDGAAGGDAAAADILYSSQTPVNVNALAKDDGIQAQLAEAMGLVFQLNAMDHSRPNWRNSDLSIDQVQDRLEIGGGADQADQLFAMLSGDSFFARLLAGGLKLISYFPSLSNMMKVMMVEMLASADKLLEALPGGTDAQGMGALMRVIINDRNQVVIDDLAAIIEQEPAVRTVGVLYGAGHLPDMEDRLVRDLGYRYDSDQWFTAIAVDVTSTGMSVKEATSMRKMMKRMLDSQIKAAKRK